MNQNSVVMTYFMLELPDGFKERLALDIAYGAAHLNDGNAGFFIRKIAVKPAFDFIGNMGNYLNGAAAVIAAALLLEYAPVNFAGGDIRIFIKTLVDKTLIMSKIQIRLGAVVGDKHFAVLDGIHCPGVNIDIWVKLLHSHLIAARFQQAPQRGGSNTLSKSGNNTAGYKHVFYWHKNTSAAYNKNFLLLIRCQNKKRR